MSTLHADDAERGVTPGGDQPTSRSQALFEDRYGPGSFRRLMAMLEQPCTTFASIAQHFGVTRERVRQWHLKLCPGAARGHARQRLCALQRSKRQLLRQPLFRTFYRHARAHVEPGRLALIPARAGVRGRTVRLDGHLVAIRTASLKYQDGASGIYALSGGRTVVDFLYYRLGPDDFLFVPRTEVPEGGASYRPDGESRYERYRNTFAASSAERGLERQAS